MPQPVRRAARTLRRTSRAPRLAGRQNHDANAETTVMAPVRMALRRPMSPMPRRSTTAVAWMRVKMPRTVPEANVRTHTNRKGRSAGSGTGTPVQGSSSLRRTGPSRLGSASGAPGCRRFRRPGGDGVGHGEVDQSGEPGSVEDQSAADTSRVQHRSKGAAERFGKSSEEPHQRQESANGQVADRQVPQHLTVAPPCPVRTAAQVGRAVA
jgi:hypothetical protein